MSDPQIQLIGVSKKYKSSLNALRTIDLNIEANAKIGIVGETGSGKSTLLRLLAGLEHPDSGTILFEGIKVDGPLEKLVPGHKDIIYLSQYSELPQFVTVEQYLDNSYHLTEEEAFEINEACKIQHLIDKDTRELSGGERQRVSFAKALTQTPKVLLLDEPFSNLDLIHKKAIKSVIEEIGKQFMTTIIMVTHDARDVLPWAESVLVLEKGGLVQQDHPREVYYEPLNKYVAGLFGEYNLIDNEVFRLNESAKHIIDNQLFVRPEEMKVTHVMDANGITMKVERVEFLGMYDQVVLSNSDHTFLASVKTGSLQIGQEVKVSI